MKRAKPRGGVVAQALPKSPHAFMREALDAKAHRVEQRHAFLRAARAGETDALASGRGYRASAVDAYFDALAAEERAPLPRLEPWRK